MTAVRRPHRTLRPAPVGAEDQQPTSLQGLANNAKTGKPPRVRDRDGGRPADLGLDGWRALQKPAARGVEGLTAAAYQAHWQANSTALVPRLTTPRARAPLAGAKRLRAIEAQDVWDCRDGARPGRGALAAVRDRTVDLQDGT